MLSRNELASSGIPGFTIGQKEKDYVQHWILSFLSRSGFAGAFKGGTALQKAFGLPRYSEDLDFSQYGLKMPDFEAMGRFLESSGFGKFEYAEEEKAISKTVKIRMHGPLYNGNEISACSVTLDFSIRDKPCLLPKPVKIIPPYKDLLPYAIPVLDAKEMAAEKVRAILTRKSARDLYDLYFLIRKGNVPELSIINKKLEFCKMEFEFSEFEGAARKLGRIYLSEMEAFTTQVVDFHMVLGEVLGKMKKIN